MAASTTGRPVIAMPNTPTAPAATDAEPIALTRAGRDEVIAYACGVCGIVAGSVMAHGDADARKRAVQCCGPSVCNRCGKPVEKRHRIMCRDCEMNAAWMREAAQFAKATVVDAATYTGPVFDDSRDEYASDLGQAIERIEDDAADDEDAEKTFYVYACTVTHGVPKFDADDLLYEHSERHDLCEGARESCDTASLQAALDAWTAEQKIESWMVDYSRVIVLDEAAAAEYRAEYERRKAATHAD